MQGRSGMEVGISTGNDRDHIKDLCVVVLTCTSPHLSRQSTYLRFAADESKEAKVQTGGGIEGALRLSA